MIPALGFIILLQLIAKAVKLHTHNRVLRWIETRRPPQGFRRDLVLRNVASAMVNIAVADILKNPSQVWGLDEDSRGEDKPHFLSLGAGFGLSSHTTPLAKLTTKKTSLATALTSPYRLSSRNVDQIIIRDLCPCHS
jgi:hypothetical protein